MKNKKFIILIICVLIIGSIGFGYLNLSQAKERIEDEIIILYQDQEIVVSHQDILNYGLVDFQANVKSSGKEPILTDFSGVLLNDVLKDHNIYLNGSENVSFNAIDGYATVVNGEEVLQDENIYLVLKRNGEFTKGKSEGGTGPIEIVIAKDPFSQRWNKFLNKIIIE